MTFLFPPFALQGPLKKFASRRLTTTNMALGFVVLQHLLYLLCELRVDSR